MFQTIRITGESLAPEFMDGDFVLVSKIPMLFKSYQVGDVVVIDHHIHGTLIKKIEQVKPGGDEFFVVGNHPLSIDSRQFGTIQRQEIIGKVILHIRKPRISLPKV